MIIIFVEFIDQLIDYPINCASLNMFQGTSNEYPYVFIEKQEQNQHLLVVKKSIAMNTITAASYIHKGTLLQIKW